MTMTSKPHITLDQGGEWPFPWRARVTFPSRYPAEDPHQFQAVGGNPGAAIRRLQGLVPGVLGDPEAAGDALQCAAGCGRASMMPASEYCPACASEMRDEEHRASACAVVFGAETITLTREAWARVVAIARNRLGWSEPELLETLRTGVLPGFSMATGVPLHQEGGGIFTRPPALIVSVPLPVAEVLGLGRP